MREAGLGYYYLADPPIYVDADKPLDAAALTGLSSGFRRSADESRKRLAHLPTPARMVSEILEAP